VTVQSGDRFIGVFSDGSRPTVTTTTVQNIFDAGRSNGATIQDLSISGAVGNDNCEPACGRGISGGEKLTVRNVRAHHNANQGIGGTQPGLLVTNSEIDHNGSASFALDGSPRSAAGIKSVNGFSVINSNVHDNYWSGVWCDNLCGAMQVRGSTLVRNGKAGIHYEASSGPAVFANNKIQSNGINNNLPKTARRAGIIIYASANVDVYGNTFGNNTFYGIHVAEDDRSWSPKLSKILIHDNTRNGDSIVGCSLLGVSCSNN
jgi:parallel beta-helix repeat protein